MRTNGMTRIGIAGIGGRMGQEILAVARDNAGVEVVFGLERADRVAAAQIAVGGEIPVTNDLTPILSRADVLIDFTTPEATVEHARACAEQWRALVAGTTGLSPAQLEDLGRYGKIVPIFYSRNMSVGINALLALLPSLVNALDGYDIEIVEAHHRHKSDAPSGTALALAEAIATSLPQPLTDVATYGRHGIAPRVPGEIGIHAVRGGGNAGEHTVIFANEGEEIRLAHRAFSRRTFALGAVRAADFVSGQSAGFYTMADLIGSR
jgi:4-hydroxy-tetrahydrodipicolinate reductase